MPQNSRLNVVDALRGFAIVSIMLLHNMEHFDFYYFPQDLPQWIKTIDHGVWVTLYFLFGGKSYAIFAFLFGLTFYIQSENQKKRGYDFRGRFAWRLFLLLIFGFFNSAFYEGDILTFYALLGFIMILVAKLPTRWVFAIAIFLMLQPYEWIKFVDGLFHPEFERVNPRSWTYFGRMSGYITGNSFIDLWKGNLTNGKIAVYLWSWEVGRYFQTPALFMLGMLAGRVSLFNNSGRNKVIWLKILIISAIVFIPLYIVTLRLSGMTNNQAILRPLHTIIPSWRNMAFMLVMLSGFTLLFQYTKANKVLNALSPMGRMSLSNYIMQTILGAFIYYGIGLGLYEYTGASYCLLIGIVLAIFQSYFSKWWMKHHKRGPLETLWHKVTWIQLRKKNIE